MPLSFAKRGGRNEMSKRAVRVPSLMRKKHRRAASFDGAGDGRLWRFSSAELAVLHHFKAVDDRHRPPILGGRRSPPIAARRRGRKAQQHRHAGTIPRTAASAGNAYSCVIFFPSSFLCPLKTGCRIIFHEYHSGRGLGKINFCRMRGNAREKTSGNSLNQQKSLVIENRLLLDARAERLFPAVMWFACVVGGCMSGVMVSSISKS